MPTVENYRTQVKNNLQLIKEKLNSALRGENLDELAPILTRINRNGATPPWFTLLETESRLPNLDGKTVGSVIEKMLVCVLERYVFNGNLNLSINPARGVDIPELELGVKSPSTNYDTSEPYFSAYERLLGNEYDAIVLLTNYQEAKGRNPFNLQIIDIKYLLGSEIADTNLCKIAKDLRTLIHDEIELKKIVRFLSYVNHSDWEANSILKLIKEVIINGKSLNTMLTKINRDFEVKNRKNLRENKALIEQDCLDRLKAIATVTPTNHAIITAAENWVILTQKDNGRYPNDNEWHRFMVSPLNGRISMSFALQWRYNFRCLFNE